MTNSIVLPAIFGSLLWFATAFLAARWLGPAWDRLSEYYLGDLMPRLRAIDMDEQAALGYLRCWGLAFVVNFAIVGVYLSMLPVAFGLTYLIFVSPRFLLDHLITQRRQLIRDQLVSASVALANAARAGLSLPQGMEKVSADLPKPLATEFCRIVSDYRHGRPVIEAINDVRQRLNLEGFTIFASALAVCMARGGRVSFALERISEGLKEMQRLERKIEADSASGRTMALILGVFPFGFMGLSSLLDPVGMGYLFNTLIGQTVLVVVGALIYYAVRWCMRILAIEV